MKTFTNNITSLSHDGRGITHPSGKVTFIKGALPGEKIHAEYTNKRAQFDEARVLSIENAHSDRQAPPCIHFGLCGGCQLQHMSPHLQIQHKQTVVLEQVKQFGQVTPTRVLPPLLGATEGYRRKARIGARYVRKKQRLLVGFREQNGRYLADLQGCEVLDPRVGKCFPALTDLIAGLSIYEHIPQIEMAAGDTEVALIFRHMKPLTATDEAALIHFGQTHHLHIYLQPDGHASIHKIEPKDDHPWLRYTLKEQNIVFDFHPTDFIQVNSDINQKMITQALSLLALDENDQILDLFCGLGNFSLPMARYAAHVTGVEGDPEMVKRAMHNARLNSLDNLAFYSTDLMGDVRDYPWFKKTYDKIVLDPPRVGAAMLIEQIASLKAKLILYVSCHPATLARDAGLLKAQGYVLEDLGVMDMFPHTDHVEAMALFKKRG